MKARAAGRARTRQLKGRWTGERPFIAIFARMVKFVAMKTPQQKSFFDKRS
jgi:predicted NAD-dependent protein-ADP-ribosyltransferase YbiA (DUF1768 family)